MCAATAPEVPAATGWSLATADQEAEATDHSPTTAEQSAAARWENTAHKFDLLYPQDLPYCAEYLP